MERFNNFYFEKFSFDLDSLEATFCYSFDQKEFFEERVFFKSEEFVLRQELNIDYINSILFHIHISLGISYYKLFPTNNLIVKSGFLDDQQIDFWKKFYINGLGEFLYKNNINISNLFNFIIDIDNKKQEKNDFSVIFSDKYLLPIGGGKDSIVSLELLKQNNIYFDTFIFGKNDKIKENAIKASGSKNLLITRKISENLFELNKKGYYNGHVPITGIIAFNMLLVSYLYDYKYLVLSNESSAEEENISWEGLSINHQYSKSLEFEKDFNNYVFNYISKDIKYFSLLRGMSEYKIASLFSKYGKKYFDGFSSCNKNFKISEKSISTNWCSECEKCAFVFLILSNFIDISELEKIFGKNLFNSEDLTNTYIGLIGKTKNKPFECVGTYEESILSISKAIKKYKNQKFKVLVELEKIIDLSGYKNLEEKLLKISNDDIIPPEVKKQIKELNEDK